MSDDDRVVKTVAAMLERYHEERFRDGIDAPTVEWLRAEISGARMVLESLLGSDETRRILDKVRTLTGKGIPHRSREWAGWDSEAQLER